tara:strand:+ start:1671 stop:2411 length:741 start_codon:yes stop_codon:yes gene_type:complete
MNETLNFNFWVPISKAKSTDKGDARIIEGIASTPHVDLQNEKVAQNGINYDYFLKHGYFNWDHKPGAENKIGEPWEVKVTPKGLYVKGIIYKGKKVADAVWEHINALTKNPDSKRKVGFSLQGKTVRRNGNSILNCWIQDIAITTAPINYNTYLDVVKAFSGYSWEEGNINKTLAAGGSVLTPESLHGDSEDVSFGGSSEKSKKSKKYTEKSLANLIQRQLGYSSGTSEKLSNVIFRLGIARRTTE